MTAHFILELESLLSRLKTSAEANPVVQKVEQDVKDIGKSALDYIKANGLTDLYQIAVAALTGAATGTPWATVGATVVTEGEKAGIAIAKGAESIVLAQAQADLIAAGKLVAPTTQVLVVEPPPVAAPITEAPVTNG